MLSMGLTKLLSQWLIVSLDRAMVLCSCSKCMHDITLIHISSLSVELPRPLLERRHHAPPPSLDKRRIARQEGARDIDA
jgi:hypothetical protein